MRIAVGLIATLLAAVSVPAPVWAVRKPADLRFPASLSEQVLHELLDVGRVDSRTTQDPEAWRRWGQVAPEGQESAMRAVIDALTGARPPLSVAASILAIARVESGWNPYSQNPTSTACGLFQFIKATWQLYSDNRESCFDPGVNAWAGVKHITMLYESHVQERIAPLALVTTEMERVEWTYRMLYAYHYHGEGSPLAPAGGAMVAQSAAENGLPQLQDFFSILKRATYVPPPARVTGKAGRARTKRRRG